MRANPSGSRQEPYSEHTFNKKETYPLSKQLKCRILDSRLYHGVVPDGISAGEPSVQPLTVSRPNFSANEHVRQKRHGLREA
jgi:hypothetical protein